MLTLAYAAQAGFRLPRVIPMGSPFHCAGSSRSVTWVSPALLAGNTFLPRGGCSSPAACIWNGTHLSQALIGRTFLQNFTMIYEGRTGTVVLHND
jgi:hypothetical protein